MKIKRCAAGAMITIGLMIPTVGVAGAQQADEPLNVDPAPAVVTPVEDPDVTMHQCNALLGALVGGVIGGTASALPGALIGAAIGAAIGWTLLYPPGPPLACWEPNP